MKNTKSILEMLDSVNTTYMSESEKHIAIANAERAEFVSSLVVSAVKSLKKAYTSVKTNLNPYTLKHA